MEKLPTQLEAGLKRFGEETKAEKLPTQLEAGLRRFEEMEAKANEITHETENAINNQEAEVIDSKDAKIEDMEVAEKATEETKKEAEEIRNIKLSWIDKWAKEGGEEGKEGKGEDGGRGEESEKKAEKTEKSERTEARREEIKKEWSWKKEKEEGGAKMLGKTVLGAVATWAGVRSPFEIKKWLNEKKEKKQTTAEVKSMVDTLKNTMGKLRKDKEAGAFIEKSESKKEAREAVIQTREKIKNSNLSAQEKAELWRQVAHISREHQKSAESENSSYGEKVEKVMDVYIDTKAQGIKAAKETLNTATMWGARALALTGVGLPMALAIGRIGRIAGYTAGEFGEKYAKSVQDIEKRKLEIERKKDLAAEGFKVEGIEDAEKMSGALRNAFEATWKEVTFRSAFKKEGKWSPKDAIKGVGLWLRFAGLGYMTYEGMEGVGMLKAAKDKFFDSLNDPNVDMTSSLKDAPGAFPWLEDMNKQATDMFNSTQINLATIHEGEGIEHALIRQLEQDPSAHGFKGNISDVEAVKNWAGSEAHRIAEKEHLADKGLIYDEKNPTMVVLKPDNTVEMTNAKTYEFKTSVEISGRAQAQETLEKVYTPEQIEKVKIPGDENWPPVDERAEAERIAPEPWSEEVRKGGEFKVHTGQGSEELGDEFDESETEIKPTTEIKSEVESGIEIGADEKIAIESFNKVIAEKEKLIDEYKMEYGDRPEFKMFENEVKAGIDLEKHSVELAQKGEAHPRVSGNMDPETFAKIAIESAARKTGLITDQEFRDLQFKELDKF